MAAMTLRPKSDRKVVTLFNDILEVDGQCQMLTSKVESIYKWLRLHMQVKVGLGVKNTCRHVTSKLTFAKISTYRHFKKASKSRSFYLRDFRSGSKYADGPTEHESKVWFTLPTFTFGQTGSEAIIPLVFVLATENYTHTTWADLSFILQYPFSRKVHFFRVFCWQKRCSNFRAFTPY